MLNHKDFHYVYNEIITGVKSKIFLNYDE